MAREIDPEDAHRQVLRAGHHRTRGVERIAHLFAIVTGPEDAL